MKVGIIGFGIMGQIRLKTLKDLSNDYQVVKICEINEENIAKLTDDIPLTSADEIINDPEIGMVFVCTPNYLNKDFVVRSLDAGKHVFAEKPPGRNLAEIEEMIAAEERNPGKLMFGFNHRHHDSMKKAKEIIDSGEFGKVLWMRGRYGKTVNENYKNTWRAKKEYAGGGIFLDQGIHMLDLFLMMVDDFDEVKAEVSDLFWNLDVEDNVFAIFKNKQGQVASLHSTMTQWRHLFSFEIFLEKGHLVINGLLTNSGSYGDNVLSIAKNMDENRASWSEEEKIQYTVNNSWENEVKIFLECVQTGKEIPVGNSKNARKLMRLVDMVYACK